MGRASRRTFLRSVGILGATGFADITGARSEPQVVSACRVIDEPGDYVLAGDLVNEEYFEPCLEITADDVVLDGRGYAIHQGSGVQVSGANVTVENLTVTGYQGIEYNQTNGGVIRNNTTRGEGGILVESTTQTVIVGNECSDDFGTISLENAERNIVRANDIHGEYGPALIDSTRNRVEDNHIQQAEVGLMVNASRNVLKGNTVASSLMLGILIRGDQNRLHQNTVPETDFRAGISLDGAAGNQLLRNEVTNGEDVGIALHDADDNRLIRNTVCGNDAGQIVIDEESTDNRLIKNETDCSQ